MVIQSVLPFFGGTSSATHSQEETRVSYLEQTVTSLLDLGFETKVFQAKKDRVSILHLPVDVICLDVDPIWLPYAAATFEQETGRSDLVYVTEADQVLHVHDEQVFEIPNNKQYLTPWRLDLVGPNGECEIEGSPQYAIDGKTYSITNGAHHIPLEGDQWSTVKIHGNQSAFSGAFLATREFFQWINFRKMRMLPVEHATGFDANATGTCVRTAWVDRCWIEHLSPRDRWASN